MCKLLSVWYNVATCYGEIALVLFVNNLSVTVLIFYLQSGVHDDLVKYLLMVRKKVKDPKVDTELVYAYARGKDLGPLEEFIVGTHLANLQSVGDRWSICNRGSTLRLCKSRSTKLVNDISPWNAAKVSWFSFFVLNGDLEFFESLCSTYASGVLMRLCTRLPVSFLTAFPTMAD